MMNGIRYTTVGLLLVLGGCASSSSSVDRPVGFGQAPEAPRLSACRCGEVVTKRELKEEAKARARAERASKRGGTPSRTGRVKG